MVANQPESQYSNRLQPIDAHHQRPEAATHLPWLYFLCGFVQSHSMKQMTSTAERDEAIRPMTKSQ
jgi:hypothetical protein